VRRERKAADLSTQKMAELPKDEYFKEDKS
jgi:hypothetical protein